MLRNSLLRLALILGLGLLAACDTAKDRAEKHFQTALEHLENGDFERATIEFRNVFKLNGTHKEARLTFARMQRELGAIPEAYGQYLRLVEQYPDNLEGRQALAEMALESGDWEEVERHGRAAAEIAPEDPRTQSMLAALNYRDATSDRDSAAQTTAFETARSLLAENPDLISAHQVVIDKLILDQDWPAALDALDAALQTSPDFTPLYTMRLAVLNEIGDMAGIEAQMLQMTKQFPNESNVVSLLLDWYLTNENFDAAEAYLRSAVDPEAESPDDRIRLIRFLSDYRSTEVALAELEATLTTTGPHDTAYRSLRAIFTYENGNAEAAITELQDILANAEPSAETNNIKTTLARMLNANDRTEQAKALVEEVITSDARHVGAAKLKARWLIQEDRTGEAIALLRAALGESPRDAELMTLLASAHERDGNRDLMAEMLSLAVEASGGAPEESLRYAAFLASNEQGLNAESVLIDALRARPDNIELLATLGTLYVDLQDWGRTQGVITRLDDFGEDTAGITNNLTARMLAGQGNEEALLSFLETLSQDQTFGQAAEIGLIRSYIGRGDIDTALTRIDSALQEAPDDPALRFVRGSILAIQNQPKEAEIAYRALLEDLPETEQVWLALYRLKTLQGDLDAAAQILAEGLDTLPGNLNLRWVQAGSLEQRGDIEGAIGIYEVLYAENSHIPLFANNLASLLATYRDDVESLERAFTIARRLRGTNIPAFQDTYGWIAYRRGDFDDALIHLEPAAQGLPNDPMVQYHLGATYAALNRNTEALEAFQTVIGLKPPAPLLEIVTAAVKGLTAKSETVSTTSKDN
ncbi:tetratricopeptide repeat protein [Ruegeria atlantica]|uniref:Tetratricopeptide repeat protein n=1 Tax=Ruegeria atlantica TaxID=81569 RepID=A0A0P1EGP6_9RHOB|nr:tetratricopeptide repeat protein [Ruegeria atlantica]CUH49055.1 tetratricopeptide repeat protein [Ruegeria atlantica]